MKSGTSIDSSKLPFGNNERAGHVGGGIETGAVSEKT